MLTFIRGLFYYKECENKKDLLAKLNCIKKNKVVKPYDSEFSNIELNVIDETITHYKNYLQYKIDSDLSVRQQIKPMTESGLHTVNLANWFSDERGYMLDNAPDAWVEFLDTAIDFALWYYLASKNPNDIITYGNSIKLRPYIINLESIADAIIEN